MLSFISHQYNMPVDKKTCLISICGPTGIGKTRIAIKLARQLKCEILSADSRQIFREMRIGTAVPSDDELKLVRHHFIRSHSVRQNYNASLFEQEVLAFLESYFTRNPCIVMVGGSGMYIDAVYRGIDDLPSIRRAVREKWHRIYHEKGLAFLQEKVKLVDPAYYEKVDRQNHKRLLKALEVYEQSGKPYSSFLKDAEKERPFHILKVGLNTDRKRLYEQINARVDRMISEGLADEARSLLPYRDSPSLKTVGYQEIFQYFDGELPWAQAIQKIKDHTRAYARRQITWFRRDPGIRWFDPGEYEKLVLYVNEEIRKHNLCDLSV